jgi:hypothetical protein
MSHKRKYRKVAPTTNLVASRSTPDLFTLSIQAHEATIIRGPQCLSTALSLEAPHLPTLGVYANDPQIGNALIQWGASTRNFQLLNSDSSFPEASDDNATWVDRWVSLVVWSLLSYGESSQNTKRQLYILRMQCRSVGSTPYPLRIGRYGLIVVLCSTQFDTKFV